MDSGVEIRTQDPDLGHTIAWWVDDLLQAFFAANPAARVVIDDGGLVGRPFRKGILTRVADFHAWRDGPDEAHLQCSSSSVVLAERPNAATVRKMLVVMGVARDAVPLDYLQVIRHQQRIRRSTAAALGVPIPADACRFLLRIDDYPSLFAGGEDFQRFHQIAVEHGLPYLLAVTPFFNQNGESRPLSAADIDRLHACTSEGAELALHGFSHRSRYANYASELAGLPAGVLRAELQRADGYLLANHLETVGFIAPYNAYDPLTVGVLAERYPLICGGPESVLALGYRTGPSFLMNRLYVPSYRDVYDVNMRRPARFDRVVAESNGLTIPVTLHWANEVRDNFRSFRALCERLRGRTVRWSGYVARALAGSSQTGPQ